MSEATPALNCTCPHCGQALAIPVAYAGQQGTCRHCGGAFTAPQAPPRAPQRNLPSKYVLMGIAVVVLCLLGGLGMLRNGTVGPLKPPPFTERMDFFEVIAPYRQAKERENIFMDTFPTPFREEFIGAMPATIRQLPAPKDYDKLKKGMTYSEVAKLLGEAKSSHDSNMPWGVERYCTWDAPNDTYINLVFTKDDYLYQIGYSRSCHDIYDSATSRTRDTKRFELRVLPGGGYGVNHCSPYDYNASLYDGVTSEDELILDASESFSGGFLYWELNPGGRFSYNPIQITDVNQDFTIEPVYDRHPVITLKIQGNGEVIIHNERHNQFYNPTFYYLRGETLRLRARPGTGSRLRVWLVNEKNFGDATTLKIPKLTEDLEIVAAFD